MALSDNLLNIRAFRCGLRLLQMVANKKTREKRTSGHFVRKRHVIGRCIERFSHIPPELKIGNKKAGIYIKILL
jgi:hypothetical protein